MASCEKLDAFRMLLIDTRIADVCWGISWEGVIPPAICLFPKCFVIQTDINPWPTTLKGPLGGPPAGDASNLLFSLSNRGLWPMLVFPKDTCPSSLQESLGVVQVAQRGQVEATPAGSLPKGLLGLWVMGLQHLLQVKHEHCQNRLLAVRSMDKYQA